MDKYWPEQDVLAAGQHSLPTRKPKDQAPSKKLLMYLTKFQKDKLTTGTIEAYESYNAQREKLVLALHKKFPKQRSYRLTISRLEVDVPKFLELLLSLHHVTHEVELINIGSHRQEFSPGIYSTNSVLYAELTIVGGQLQQEIYQAPVPAQSDTANARVVIDNCTIRILCDGKIYTIAKLQEGRAPYLFMQYITQPDNSNIDIKIDEIRRIKGCEATDSLSELVRQCGFDKALKKLFFPVVKKDKIHFSPTGNINRLQLGALKERSAKIESKS